MLLIGYLPSDLHAHAQFESSLCELNEMKWTKTKGKPMATGNSEGRSVSLVNFHVGTSVGHSQSRGEESRVGQGRAGQGRAGEGKEI